MLNLITNLTRKIENYSLKTGFVYSLACKYYHSVIEKEIALANITANDHILCIGGGICPFSAILFHQTTGARVTVIDNNSKCVKKAQQVIDKLGINEKVHVYHQDGNSQNIMFADYTVIHFALQVCPMEHVFFNVERQAVDGTRLLVRRPKKQLDNMYCHINCLSPCNPHAAHRARNIGSTIMYTKKATA